MFISRKLEGKVDCKSKKSKANGERGKRAKAVYYRNRVISGLHSRSRTLSQCWFHDKFISSGLNHAIWSNDDSTSTADVELLPWLRTILVEARKVSKIDRFCFISGELKELPNFRRIKFRKIKMNIILIFFWRK